MKNLINKINKNTKTLVYVLAKEELSFTAISFGFAGLLITIILGKQLPFWLGAILLASYHVIFSWILYRYTVLADMSIRAIKIIMLKEEAKTNEKDI